MAATAKFALVVLVLCSEAAVGQRDNESDQQPKPKVNLGFDPTQIQPPEKPQPISRVWTEYIYAEDKQGEDPSVRIARFQSRILTPLLDRFAKQQKITVSDDEVQQFTSWFESIGAETPVPQKIDAAEAKAAAKTVGTEMIRSWKISRALFETYGGTVIFQQGNPFEPVGALRDFLREMERAQAFEIFDPELKKQFWTYFEQKHPFVVPPDKVDYSEPWWKKRPD